MQPDEVWNEIVRQDPWNHPRHAQTVSDLREMARNAQRHADALRAAADLLEVSALRLGTDEEYDAAYTRRLVARSDRSRFPDAA